MKRKADNREDWYSAADVIYCTNGIKGNSNYALLDPISADDELQSVQVVNAALTIINRTNNPVAIPVNIGNNHWVALVLTPGPNGTVNALYADPLGMAPANNAPLFQTLRNHGINIINRSLIQQPNGYDCGPFTVMNLHALATTGQLPAIQTTEEEILRQRAELSQLQGMQEHTDYDNSTNDLSRQLLADSKRFNDLKISLFPKVNTGKPVTSQFASGKATSVKVSQDKHLQALDSLSKAFSTNPYTAIVECNDKNTPYHISVADGSSLSASNVNEISSALDNVISNRIPMNYEELFRCMYLARNSRILELIRTEQEKITTAIERLEREVDERNEYLKLIDRRKAYRYRLSAQEQNDFNTLDRKYGRESETTILKNLRQAREELQINHEARQYFQKLAHYQQNTPLDHKFFSQFTRDNFFKLLSEQELDLMKEEVKLLKNGKVEIVREKYGRGIHVELQGLSSARQKNLFQSEFNVGLSNAKDQIPYCCAGCTAERIVLERHGIKMNVTAISHDNFPPGFYHPSPNVTEDPKLFVEYLRELHKQAEKKPATHPDLKRILDVANEIELMIKEQERLLEKQEETSKQLLQVSAKISKQNKDDRKDEGKNNLKRNEKAYLTEVFKFNENNKGFHLQKWLVKVAPQQESIIKRLIIESQSRANQAFEQPKKNIFSKLMDRVLKRQEIKVVPESDHIAQHSSNTKDLIRQMRDGELKSGDIVALERKQAGDNLGMSDVILIAKIIKHNENPKTPKEDIIDLPKRFEETLIYKDAVLYNAAEENGIKVVGMEGKDLEHNKESSFYNQGREEHMKKTVSKLAGEGNNIKILVGEAHKQKITAHAQTILEKRGQKSHDDPRSP